MRVVSQRCLAHHREQVTTVQRTADVPLLVQRCVVPPVPERADRNRLVKRIPMPASVPLVLRERLPEAAECILVRGRIVLELTDVGEEATEALGGGALLHRFDLGMPTSHLPASWRKKHKAALDWSCAFVLLPVDDGRRTRFVFRSRWTTAPWWLTLGGWLAVVPADFVMSRDMLHGVKQRAEAVASTGPDIWETP